MTSRFIAVIFVTEGVKDESVKIQIEAHHDIISNDESRR